MPTSPPPPSDPIRSLVIGEDAFRALADAFEEACVFLIDRRGSYVAVNHAFATWIGRPQTEILGHTAYDVWPCLTAERDALDDLRVLGGEVVERDEQRPRAAAGASGARAAHADPRRRRDGGSRLGVFRDVTAGDAEDVSRRQAARLELVGRLASGVAHDFNNLLTPLLGHLALLQRLHTGRRPGPGNAGRGRQGGRPGGRPDPAAVGLRAPESAGPEPTDLNAVVGQMVGLLRRTFDPRIQIDVRLCKSACRPPGRVHAAGAAGIELVSERPRRHAERRPPVDRDEHGDAAGGSGAAAPPAADRRVRATAGGGHGGRDRRRRCRRGCSSRPSRRKVPARGRGWAWPSCRTWRNSTTAGSSASATSARACFDVFLSGTVPEVGRTRDAVRGPRPQPRERCSAGGSVSSLLEPSRSALRSNSNQEVAAMRAKHSHRAGSWDGVPPVFGNKGPAGRRSPGNSTLTAH